MTVLRGSTGMKRIVVACAWALCFAPARAGAQVEVRAACYRIKTPADPGSATVLVRNSGRHPVAIDQLLMDGSPLPADGIGAGLTGARDGAADAAAQLAAARVVWACLRPNPIPPGRSAWLYVQLRSRPAYGFRLGLRVGGAVVAEHKLLPIDDPVRIASIAFPEGLSRCLVYAANASGDEPQRLRRIELNDADVSGRTWASSRSIAPGAKELIVISRPALEVGGPATVHLAFESGRCAVARVRALPLFPVVLQEGGPDPRLGVTEAAAVWPVPSDAEQPPRVPAAASCVQVFRCPSHVLGSDWQGCAAEILRRRAAAMRLRPRLPAFVAVCRASSQLACPCFAHTTDAGYLNPYLPTYSTASPPHPVDALFRALAMCRAANAPDPVFAVVPCHTFGDGKLPSSPEELRRLVYGVLACGARGLLYRPGPQGSSPQQAQCVRTLNRKVEALKPFLLAAEPVPWASSSRSEVKAQALLAGERGLILIVLNRGDGRGRLTGPAAADVTVRLPQWMPPQSLVRQSDAIEGSVTVEPRQIRVTLQRLPAAALLAFRASPDR